MILVDISHTSHTRARTGIQRVARSLVRELETDARGAAVTWDPHERQWRRLDSWERANLSEEGAGHSRGARWPLGAKLRGQWRRISKGGPGLPEAGMKATGIIFPELFSPAVSEVSIQLRSRSEGPAIALFHDAIALKRPAMFPRKTVARFPGYLQELAHFDGVAAVSEDSRRALSDYWDWLGLKDRPPLVSIPLGIDAPALDPSGTNQTLKQDKAGSGPEILCLCTIEGRKNHLALLEACEALWRLGHPFSLHLAGMARPESAAAALKRIAELQATGRPIRHSGPVNEAELEQCYAQCALTIYPSLEEGYGLPVVESLIRGKPCVCSGAGALGEISRAGGCLTLGELDAGNIAAALGHLLSTPALLEQLKREAVARRFKSWSNYSAELVAWMAGLRRR